MTKNAPRDYLKQLDTVRAVAVMMVIVSHWAPGLASFWLNGIVGVQLFFVISGYLITGILLDARSKAEESGLPLAGVIRNFYARRFLRIFPLFYATLAIAYVLGFPAVRATIGWHAAYLSNVYFAMTGGWLGEVSHFWSLAVEEQFYLVWPFLILFAPKRHLLPLIAIVVAIGPAFRFCGANFLGLGEVALVALPFSSLDTLGLGGLLALLQRQRNTRGLAWLAALSVAGFCTFVLLHLIFGFQDTSGSSLARTALAPALLGVVWLAARGVPGPFGRLVELPPLIYLGRISYGLYVFHNFVPAGTAAVMRKVGVMPLDTLSPALLFALNFAVLLVVSSASWHFYESPMNQLKRLFPYASRSLAPAASLQQARL